MANGRRSGLGFSLRLGHEEMKRLDTLARACGRSREGTVCALLRWASARDVDLVRRLRENAINIQEDGAEA